ncbi:glucose 1-dehydrogenase (plasmid) [Burkholderia thailandensis]|uniref:glucose 1-dehydrogenase n=1 Tax=Burkholderia thailandensis TaxID=57975 RepID=UPI00192E1D12|nr:glucose 1-dehydrogenase [Burkholderia thailandensis]MBS2132175.1 glucose 1-dehydrogenase [Burkholderia thailandensis]QRA15387.1 glucose 1-dehydrogenase [Burkholderia thailandensis]
MGRVDGKVALVTGARRGLGKASAVMLAREGATVALTDRKEEGADAVLRAISDAGGRAVFIQQDVSRADDWKRVIDDVVQRFGKLDILVNNAGVGAGKNIEELSLEDWRWVMSVNLDGVFLGTKHAIEAMKKTGGGSIINMSSIEGMVGDRRLPAYDASKGGVRIFTKSAALHCAKAGYNIRVNSLHPGFIDTPMVTGFTQSQGDAQAARKELEALHPIGHLGEPDDVAYAVLYLASEESKFVTGSELVVDGGFTAQ